MLNKSINILGGLGPFDVTITYYDPCITLYYNSNPIASGYSFSIGSTGSTFASFNIEVEGCEDSCAIDPWVNIQVSWTDDEGQICLASQTVICDDISVDIICDMVAEFTDNGLGNFTVRFKDSGGSYLSRDDVFDLVELHNYILDVYNRTDPETTLTVGGSSAFTGILQGTLNLLYTIGNNFNYENTSSDGLVDNISFTNNNNILEINFKLKDLSGELPMAYMLYKSYGENQLWTQLPLSPAYTPANFNGNNSGLPQGSARFCPLIGVSTGLEYTNLLKMCDGDCFEFTNHPLVPCNTEWAVVNLPCAGIVPIDLNDCTPDQIRVDYYNWNGANRYTIIVNGVEVAKSPWQSLRAFPSQIDQYFSIVADCEAEDETNFNNTIFVTLSPSDTFNQYLGVFTDLHGWEINPSSGLTTYNFIDGGIPATYNLSLLPDHHFYYINLPPANPNFTIGPTMFGTLIWTNDNNETVNSLEIKVDTEYSDATYGSFYVHCPTCISCELSTSVADITTCLFNNQTIEVNVFNANTTDQLDIIINGVTESTLTPTISNFTESITTNVNIGINTVTVVQGECQAIHQFEVIDGNIEVNILGPEQACENGIVTIEITDYNPLYAYSYTVNGGLYQPVLSNPFDVLVVGAIGDLMNISVLGQYIGCQDSENLSIPVINCDSPVTLECIAPDNQVMPLCESQANIDSAWNAWLLGFQQDLSGQPEPCGSVTETWTLDSINYTNIGDIPVPQVCEGNTYTVGYQLDGCGLQAYCEAEFLIQPGEPIQAACPGSESYQSSDFANQTEVDTSFSNWVNSFVVFSDGCYSITPQPEYLVTETWTVLGIDYSNTTDLINAHTPDITGGSVTVTYSITNPCGQSAECSFTYTIESCPASVVIESQLIDCDYEIDILPISYNQPNNSDNFEINYDCIITNSCGSSIINSGVFTQNLQYQFVQYIGESLFQGNPLTVDGYIDHVEFYRYDPAVPGISHTININLSSIVYGSVGFPDPGILSSANDDHFETEILNKINNDFSAFFLANSLPDAVPTITVTCNAYQTTINNTFASWQIYILASHIHNPSSPVWGFDWSINHSSSYNKDGISSLITARGETYNFKSINCDYDPCNPIGIQRRSFGEIVDKDLTVFYNVVLKDISSITWNQIAYPSFPNTMTTCSEIELTAATFNCTINSTYDWTGPSGPLVENTQTIVVTEPGLYTVEIQCSECGNTIIDSFTVT